MPLPYRIAMSNLWLFGPIIERYCTLRNYFINVQCFIRVMTYFPDNNGAIRTTGVASLISGGIKVRSNWFFHHMIFRCRTMYCRRGLMLQLVSAFTLPTQSTKYSTECEKTPV